MIVDIQDLLHLRFEDGQGDPLSGAIDCLGAVAAVFRKLGWSTERLDPSGLDGDAREIADAAWEYMGPDVASATEIGDLILSYPIRQRPHVSVVIDSRLGLSFSSHQGHGAMTVPLGQITKVRGVYRLMKEYR